MVDAKYIELKGSDSNPGIVIFDAGQLHRNVYHIFDGLPILSAGQANFLNGSFRFFGESISLSIRSRKLVVNNACLTGYKFGRMVFLLTPNLVGASVLEPASIEHTVDTYGDTQILIGGYLLCSE
jgi:hypothetical protein